MLEQVDLIKIKDAVREFLDKMTINSYNIEVNLSSTKSENNQTLENKERDVVNLDIRLNEPQILIGQQGQTLFDVQRLLRLILNKKFQQVFYVNLDINDYKKKKIEYLKNLAKETADQVFLTKEEKALPPMPAYERRIVHTELSQRTDVITESRGEGVQRHIVIKSR